jgi:hypothetical protein
LAQIRQPTHQDVAADLNALGTRVHDVSGSNTQILHADLHATDIRHAEAKFDFDGDQVAPKLQQQVNLLTRVRSVEERFHARVGQARVQDELLYAESLEASPALGCTRSALRECPMPGSE